MGRTWEFGDLERFESKSRGILRLIHVLSLSLHSIFLSAVLGSVGLPEHWQDPAETNPSSRLSSASPVLNRIKSMSIKYKSCPRRTIS
jgi:hypothetical protein